MSNLKKPSNARKSNRPTDRLWRSWFISDKIVAPTNLEVLMRPSLAYEWLTMMTRCYDPNGPLREQYFTKIFVCERWMNFPDGFVPDVGPEHPGILHALVRKDPSRHYDPTNWCWAVTSRERVPDNKVILKSNSILIEYQGQEKTLAQWSEYFGCKTHNEKMRFRNRYNSGYKLEYCNISEKLYTGSQYEINKLYKREE